MNKKNTIITALAATIGIVVFFFIFLSKTVSNEQLTKEIYENVSLLLEKSTVKHNKVDVSFGWNLKFNIPDFQVISTIDQKPLISIKSIEVKAPLLSLFFPGFPVRYDFRDMKIQVGEQFNQTISINKLQERMTYKNLFRIKTFKEGSKHQVFIENTNILNGGISFPIQSIYFNNFSWSRPVAYEIKHQIKESRLIPDLYVDYSLIGEVDLGKSIEKKSLRTKSQIKINSLKIGKVIEINQALNGTINLHVAGKDLFDGHFNTTGPVELDSRFFLKKGVLDLHNLSMKIPVSNVSTISYLLPNATEKNRIEITGDILGIGSEKVTPKFQFEFMNPISSTIEDFSFTSTLKGIVENNLMDASFHSKFGEGEFLGSLKAPVFSKTTGLLFRLDKDVELDVLMKNVDLKIMSLKRKSFYTLLKKFSMKNELSDKFKVVNLKIADCRFGEEKLSGGGTLKKTKSGMISKNFELLFGEGGLKADFDLNKKYFELDMSLKKFNLDGLASISNHGRLPVSGIFSGSLRGVYSKSDQFSHEFEIDLKGENGEVDKGQSIDSVGSAMEQISPDLKLSKSTNAFKEVQLRGKFANNKLVASKIHYIDKKEEFKVTGKGDVTITDVKENNYIGENSLFFVSLTDLKKKLWTKESSLNLPQKIPLKIKRTNGEWLPDLLYTINKIKEK